MEEMTAVMPEMMPLPTAIPKSNSCVRELATVSVSLLVKFLINSRLSSIPAPSSWNCSVTC